MGATELLKLVITADTKGAAANIKTLGKESEVALGKGATGAERFTASLTKIGAASVGIGAILGVGLYKAAKASQEAELAGLKLQNSMAGNPKLAGDSSKAFLELAHAISQKTEADHISVTAGEAVLAQFPLTQQQILTLTPLLVDYAQKTGNDIPTAAGQLGKALFGQGRALKSVGIDFHNAGSVAANYDQIIAGLSRTVGGFAEEQGKTFSGQLVIMKNNLKELEEGIGKGAVEAFGNLFHQLSNVTGAMEKLSPGIQGTIGKTLTYGSAVLVAGGVTAVVAGQVLKLRDAFMRAGIALKLFTVDMAEEKAVATGLGAGLGLVGGALVVAGAAWYGYAHRVKVSIDAEKEAGLTSADLLQHYKDMAAFLGAGSIDRYLNQLDLGTLMRLRDELKAAGVDTQFVDKAIADLSRTQKQQAADSAAGATALDDTGEAAKKAGAGLLYASNASARFADELHRTNDEQLKLLGSIKSAEEADIAYDQAIQNTRAAIQNATSATDDHKTANDEVAEAMDTAKQSVIDQGDAAETAAEQHKGSALTVTEAAYAQVVALGGVANTLAPGSPLRVWLDQYIAALAAVPTDVSTAVHVSGNYGGTYTPPGGTGPRAGGGRVMAGGSYVVGEQGWEPFVPDRGGYVVNHDDAVRAVRDGSSGGSAGGSTTILLQLDGEVLARWVRKRERALR